MATTAEKQTNRTIRCTCGGKLFVARTVYEPAYTKRFKTCSNCGASSLTYEVMQSYYDRVQVALERYNDTVLPGVPSPTQPASEPERQPDPLPAQVTERAPTYDEWLEQNKRADNVDAWEEWSHIPGVELPPDPEDQEGFTGYGGEAA